MTDVAPALAITSLGGGAAAATDVAELSWGSVARITTAGASGNVRYSIVPTGDYQAFTVDGAGWLSFSTVPDFEDPHDADGDNVYSSPFALMTMRAATRRRSPLPSRIRQPDRDHLEWRRRHRLDQFCRERQRRRHDRQGCRRMERPCLLDRRRCRSGAFQLDGNGVLRFASVPDFENARDVDGDNVYEVIVAAKDVEGADTQAISVHVVNFSPITITSNGGGDTTSVDFAENGTGVVTTVRASGAISQPGYAIVGGADAALFVIDSSRRIAFRRGA